MGLFKSSARKKALEYKRKELSQAEYRRALGTDVTEDRIDIHVRESRKSTEVLMTSLRRVFSTILTIVIFVFAVLGAIAVFMPGPREEMLGLFNEVMAYFE